MKNTKRFSLLCILLLSSLAIQYGYAEDELDREFGTHDPQTFEPEIIDVEEEYLTGEDRRLIAYPRLRIITDYTHLTAGTDEFKTYVKDQLIPAVVSYLRGALQVKYPVTTPIVSTAAKLCGFATPQILKDGIRGDIVFIINSKYDSTGGWMAATTSCALTSGVRKPLVVNVGINTYAIGTAKIDENPLNHDLYVNTLFMNLFMVWQ